MKFHPLQSTDLHLTYITFPYIYTRAFHVRKRIVLGVGSPHTVIMKGDTEDSRGHAVMLGDGRRTG